MCSIGNGVNTATAPVWQTGTIFALVHGLKSSPAYDISRNIPAKMAWQAGDPRDDDEYRRLLHRQLDKLWTFICWRRRCVAIPACISILLFLHTVVYRTLASGISSVSILNIIIV
jgi:hypothetical protein